MKVARGDSFASLFRQSRLASLPSPIKPPQNSYDSVVSYDNYPTRQVLTSKKATRHRGDWGLKRPLPQLKTSVITVSEHDSQIHQTTFQSANEVVKVVNRWREAQIPLSNNTERLFSRKPYKSPFGPRSSIAETSNTYLPQADRSGIRQYVDTYQSNNYDGQYMEKNAYRTSPTAGLSYALPGAIASTKNGAPSTQKSGGFIKYVPGRSVGAVDERDSTVAVMGVVAKSVLSPDSNVPGDRSKVPRSKIRSKIVNFIPSFATIDKSGKIDLEVISEANLERAKLMRDKRKSRGERENLSRNILEGISLQDPNTKKTPVTSFYMQYSHRLLPVATKKP